MVCCKVSGALQSSNDNPVNRYNLLYKMKALQFLSLSSFFIYLRLLLALNANETIALHSELT